MNGHGQLIDIADFDMQALIMKRPIQVGIEADGQTTYLSEIWYKTDDMNKPCIPIIKSPRLRVQYSAKRYQENGPYSYCLSTYNSDIDPDISEFYQFIKDLDRRLTTLYIETRKQWGFKPTNVMKYWSSVRTKTTKNGNSIGYMQIKTIHDEDGELLTSIHDRKGEKQDIDKVEYGKYTDQLLSLQFLYFNSRGMTPGWKAHQIVLSTTEKVFLEYCLLDDLYGNKTPVFEAKAYTPPYVCNQAQSGYTTLHPLPPLPPPQLQPLPARPVPPQQLGPGLSIIKADELRAAIQKLKSTTTIISDEETDADSEDNESLARQLQQRKDEITAKAQRELIINSADY